MIEILAKRLNDLDRQNTALAFARGAYLLKEAERKNFEAHLVQDAKGKSHAERVINAQATNEWVDFQKKLAELENDYEFQRLKYEILEKGWLAEHLSLKLDGNEMKKQI